MATHRQPRWVHSSHGLAITMGLREDPVPAVLAARLKQATTADPAENLVELEGEFRGTVSKLTTLINQAELAVTSARRQVSDTEYGWGLTAWLHRRRANAELADAIGRQAELRELLDEAITLRDTLRQFVIGLDTPSGLLRESANGWQRSPDVPASVVVFGPEDSFIAADSRRMKSGWVGAHIAGQVYGEQWRRDGDDDGPYSRPLDRAGPWLLGFIPRTGEIYASRRCGYLPEEVWLLGRSFAPEHAHDLLTELLPRMREPNSLILAAGVLHASRWLRPHSRWAALRIQ